MMIQCMCNLHIMKTHDTKLQFVICSNNNDVVNAGYLWTDLCLLKTQPFGKISVILMFNLCKLLSLKTYFMMLIIMLNCNNCSFCSGGSSIQCVMEGGNISGEPYPTSPSTSPPSHPPSSPDPPPSSSPGCSTTCWT